MGRLIIASNRVSLPNGQAQAGGLAVALQDALKENGGVWCGWSGNIREYPKTSRRSHDDVDYVTLDYTQQEYDDFYVGFSNSTLWPLFHYRVGLSHFSHAYYAAYQEVNRKFAAMIKDYATPDDTIWVHDYHLLTTGKHLRDLDVDAKTGFFLHIPFPAPELMATCPPHEEILEAMCAYDLIGFQTAADLHAFQRCIIELCNGSLMLVDDNTLTLSAFGREFRAGYFPISIDTEEMAETAAKAGTSAETRRMVASLDSHKLIIGVDRLDYSKGLIPRLKAYEYFLENHTELATECAYLQITPPSRTDVEEYRDLREDLEKLAANINGKHATLHWSPIRYLCQSFGREELAGLYRLARIGLVTPMRDGMNLVAKEYVASQDAKNPGVLVLSRFAGAAQELDAALLVNPHDIKAVSSAIQRGLTMSLKERQERYQSMMNVLHKNTVFDWKRNFLAALDRDTAPAKSGNLLYPSFFGAGSRMVNSPVK